MKEQKQAEFLAFHSVPWQCINGIGVKSKRIKERVEQILSSAQHQPLVKVKNDWYY